jgi:hypothetical protein
MSTTVLPVFNSLVLAAKSGGWFSGARLWVFCAEKSPTDVSSLRLNIFDPAEVQSINSGSGTYTFSPLSGLSFDGTATRLDTGKLIADVVGPSSGMILAYLNSQETGGTGTGDAGSGSSGRQIGFFSFEGGVSGFWYGSPITKISRSSPAGIGLYGVGRDGGDMIAVQNAGREDITVATTGLMPTANLTFGGLRNDYSQKEFSFGYSRGTPLSLHEIQSVRLAFRTALEIFGTARTPPDPTPLGPNYWTRASIGTVLPAGAAVFRQNAPPISDTQTNLRVGDVPGFSRFPQTDVDYELSGTVLTNPQTLIRGHARAWMCRFNNAALNKPNPVQGVEVLVGGKTVRQVFNNSYDHADGQTVATVMRLLGYSDAAIQTEMLAWGYTDTGIDVPGAQIFTAAYADANADTLFPSAQMGFAVNTYDFVVIPPHTMADVVSGTCNDIRLDMEMADNRPPAQFEKVVDRCLDFLEAQGKTCSFGTNAFQNQGASTGITKENMTRIYARSGVRWAQIVVVDAPSAAGQAADLLEQLSYFTYGGAALLPSKVQVAASIGVPAMSDSNALAGHQVAVDYGLSYRITAGRSPWGGDKTEPWNRSMGLFLTGALPP